MKNLIFQFLKTGSQLNLRQLHLLVEFVKSRCLQIYIDENENTQIDQVDTNITYLPTAATVSIYIHLARRSHWPKGRLENMALMKQLGESLV